MPRLTANGRRVSRKRVARLMREAGLAGVSRRRGTRTTRVDQRPSCGPDRVERQFQADGPDRIWVADITYVPTWAGFVYLAVVLDVFSRRIVGWCMAHHLRTELVLGALNMALGQRRPYGVVHHSDRGTQYPSLAFGKRCREMGVLPSTGRPATAMTRHGRELLRHAGVRAHRPAFVPYPGRGAHGDLPIHRRLVQPTPPALRPGLPQPQRLRTRRGEGNAGCSAQRSSSGRGVPGACWSGEPKGKISPPAISYPPILGKTLRPPAVAQLRAGGDSHKLSTETG